MDTTFTIEHEDGINLYHLTCTINDLFNTKLIASIGIDYSDINHFVNFFNNYKIKTLNLISKIRYNNYSEIIISNKKYKKGDPKKLENLIYMNISFIKKSDFVNIESHYKIAVGMRMKILLRDFINYDLKPILTNHQIYYDDILPEEIRDEEFRDEDDM